MHKKIIAGVLAFVAALVVLVGLTAKPADAAVAAKANLGNACNSQRAVYVEWQNSYTDYTYTGLVPVCATHGEGGSKQNTSEPRWYRTDPGWCSRYQHVINGYTYAWSPVVGGGDTFGNWTYVGPQGYERGDFHVRVHHWDC